MVSIPCCIASPSFHGHCTALHCTAPCRAVPCLALQRDARLYKHHRALTTTTRFVFPKDILGPAFLPTTRPKSIRVPDTRSITSLVSHVLVLPTNRLALPPPKHNPYPTTHTMWRSTGRYSPGLCLLYSLLSIPFLSPSTACPSTENALHPTPHHHIQHTPTHQQHSTPWTNSASRRTCCPRSSTDG